ncbi:hypothetical protein D3C72_2022440 [compost metagenome]
MLRIALGETRKNADVAADIGHRDGACGNRRKGGRRVEIACLLPALLGARHAADDHGQVRRCGHRRQMGFQHG